MTIKKPTKTRTTGFIEHLDGALEELLVARVKMGLLAEPLPVPAEFTVLPEPVE